MVSNFKINDSYFVILHVSLTKIHKFAFFMFSNVWEVSIWIEAQIYLQNNFEENSYSATTWSVIYCLRTKYQGSEWSMESGIAFRERYAQRHAGTRILVEILLQNKAGVRSAYVC